MSTNKKPYQLPEPLVIDEDELLGGITFKVIEEYIKKHSNYLQRYKYLESLYKGFHDIFNKPDKENWKPDARLAINFPRYITDTFVGYGYGIPIKVSHPEEAVNEALQKFARNNELTDHEAEMVKKCCIYGHAFEYIYQDEEARTKVSSISPAEMFVVYDDTMKQRALFSVRYGYHKSGKDEKVMYGEVVTREKKIYFDDGKILSDLEEINPYGRINCVEWRLNDERLGLFENVAGPVEIYNMTIGEKANDVQAFAEAYMAVLGAELDEDGIYKIRDNRVINLYGTDNAKDIVVEFLQKPTADGTQENLLDRLEKLIYQVSMVANISDEAFGNSSSGTSLAYKLQSMSNLALTFDRKIEKSIRKRCKLFCSLSTNVSDPNAYEDIEIKMTRNIPKNIAEEAQVAKDLSGIVSQATQLSVLSVVQDPQAEIKALEEENKADSIATEQMFKPTEEVNEQ